MIVIQSEKIYILYRYLGEGHGRRRYYVCEYENGEYGTVTRTRIKGKAKRLTAAEVIEIAPGREFYIESLR